MLGESFDDLLGRARSGDGQAFAEIWRDAHPMLLRYLRVTAGIAAEDVASHTWIRVIESLGSFTGDEPGFRRWLVTIARNHHLDQVRRTGRRPERLVSDVVTLVDDLGHAAPDAATVAERQLSTDDALRLIATLPGDQAEMVMLRVVMGLGVAEVAEVVGRTPGAVRVGVHRSLRRLADELTRRSAPARPAAARPAAAPSAPARPGPVHTDPARSGPVKGLVTQRAALAFPHRDA